MSTINIALKNNYGNSFKDLYYDKIQNGKEVSELEHLYRIMCDNPEVPFCLDHIEDIFGKTNISSRLFKKLEVNGLIENIEAMVNKNGVKVMHYKVIDPNKEFTIKKEIKLNKEIKDIEKEIQKVVRFCINPNIEYNSKNKILKMISDIINELGNGESIESIKVRNLFDDEFKKIEASYYLTKIVRFVENYKQ